MRTVGWGLLLAAMLVNGPGLGASFYNDDELLGHCRQPSETPSRYYCFGYVIGVAEVLHRRQEICLPPAVTPERLMDVVMQYLEETSGSLNEPAHISVSVALVRAFPCQ